MRTPTEREELLIAMPRPLPPLTGVRSTLLLASVESLRDEGYFEAYDASLGPAARREVLQAVAGAWVSVEAAQEHYAACDGLGLAASVQAALGGRTFRRMKGTLLGTAVRAAAGAGVTPWTIMGMVDRFWARAYQGSGIGVLRTGPKDAEVEMAGTPLVTSAYYRNAFRGLVVGLFELVTTRCIVAELPAGATPTARRFRAQWA